jgi:hypothetical protein
MFRMLRDNKGQGTAVQYALTFFLVVAVVSAMTVYVKRAIQGRLRDARWYMARTVDQVYSDPSFNIAGDLWLGYEPYYVNTNTHRFVDRTTGIQTVPGSLAEGIHQYEIDATTTLKTSSPQAPPAEAD